MNVVLEVNLEIPLTIIELDREFFPHPWSKKAWEELNREHYRLYKIFDKKETKIEGFAIYQSLRGEDCSHLLKIMTHPRRRNMGLGRYLLNESMKDLARLGWTKVYLEVEEDNLPAVGLYQNQGFNILRKIENFYGDGRHALAMSTGIA